MSVSRVAARLARALGFTPSQDQVASALLGVPPAQARAELYREAAAALTACATGHDVATRADFATNERRLREPLSRDERRTYTNDAKKLHAVSPPPPPPAAVRASSVPGAGAGLFTTRHVPRGSLVALYGGVYVPPVPPVTPGADGVALIIPAARAAAEDDAAAAYVIHLAAGGYLDGAAHAAAARAAADAGQCAGWGVAALANHPPRGVEPNVVAVDVAWAETGPPGATTTEGSRDGDDVPPDATSFLPRFFRARDEPSRFVASSRRRASFSRENERLARETVNPVKRDGPWYIDGATGSPVTVPLTVPTRGVAFVASRALEPGTEVFFDYRLSSRPLPAWYAPVPAEVAWRIVDGE